MDDVVVAAAFAVAWICGMLAANMIIGLVERRSRT